MVGLVHLSDAWIAALAKAAAAHEGLRSAAENTSLVVEYRVTSNPAVLWHVILDRGEVMVLSGSADNPDFWFEARPDVASALFDGKLDPLRAVIDGDLSMGGNPRSLLEHREVLDGIGDVFAGVRAATSGGGG